MQDEDSCSPQESALPTGLETRPPDVFVEAARAITRTLSACAVRTRDGSVFWRHPTEAVEWAPSAVLGPYLYHGVLGTALFLAFAARVLKSEDLRDICLRAIAPLRREIREVVSDRTRWLKVAHPVGALVGLGSMIYGLIHVGEDLEDSSILDDAHAISALITPDRIEADENHDVMQGSAGALLALLALHRRQPDAGSAGPAPLAVATLCGRKLVHCNRLLKDTLSSGSLGAKGFCHGAAGITTALLRLYALIGEPEFREVVQRSFQYERALYVSPADTGKSCYCDGPVKPFNNWCKGTPGIALSRLAARGLIDDEFLEEELMVALTSTQTGLLIATDDLCCGNAGRLDILLYASKVLGDQTYLESARDLGSRMLARAQREGAYRLTLNQSGILDLRFFPGLAGIGYALLRLAEESKGPCVLAIE